MFVLSTVIVFCLTAFQHVWAFNLHSGRTNVNIIRHQTRSHSSFELKAEKLDVPIQSQKLARLQAMAAKLRAEASELEAEQQLVVNDKLAEAFALLDTNNDGKISLQELKDALSTQLESIVSEEQTLKIMKKFDTSNNGFIELDEFKGVEAFKMLLEKVLQEEKQAGVEATSQALIAKQASELAEKKVASINEQVNQLPPTSSDKILSLIPYLLPLCDVLPYARSFIVDNGLETNNPILEFASFVFLLYQTIPFSGLIAFFLFSTISNNLKLNRLVRFNIQQAIFLDIALIFPGIIGGIASVAATQAKFDIPLSIQQSGSTAVFLSISAAIIYSMGSSIAGVLPDKVPLISDRVKVRVPTAEDILKMLNDQENFMIQQEKEKKMLEKKKKEEKKEDIDQ